MEQLHPQFHKRAVILTIFILAVIVIGFLQNFVFAPKIPASPQDFLNSQLAQDENSTIPGLKPTKQPAEPVIVHMYKGKTFEFLYLDGWNAEAVSVSGNSGVQTVVVYPGTDKTTGIQIQISAQKPENLIAALKRQFPKASEKAFSFSAIKGTQIDNGEFVYIIFGQKNSGISVSYSKSFGTTKENQQGISAVLQSFTITQ